MTLLLLPIYIVIVGFIFVYQINYISKSGHLCDPDTGKNFLQLHLLQSLLIPGVAFIAAIISFIIPGGLSADLPGYSDRKVFLSI
jgi:hypothetical protein